MGTYCITGAANGIALATRHLLEEDGHRVIGVDLRGSDIDADLGTAAGRRNAVDAVAAMCGGHLDGLAPIAGVNGMGGPDVTVRINYFGAVAMAEGLHDALAAAGNATVVFASSNSTIMTPGLLPADAQPYLDGDEDAAVAAFAERGWIAYPAGKLALAYWVRSNAVTERWIGSGIRVNAVAPGVIDTNMTRSLKEIPGMDEALSSIPMPIGRTGSADEIGRLFAFLLGRDASYIVGQTIIADGGTDALLQPRSAPVPLPG